MDSFPDCPVCTFPDFGYKLKISDVLKGLVGIISRRLALIADSSIANALSIDIQIELTGWCLCLLRWGLQ
jgi:hypothetical protein